MIQTIREFFYKRAIIRQKRRAIYELQLDLEFIKKVKGEMLSYNEAPARKRMAELKKEENLSDIQEQELNTIVSVIAESKATKEEYRKSKQVMEELIQYVNEIL